MPGRTRRNGLAFESASEFKVTFISFRVYQDNGFPCWVNIYYQSLLTNVGNGVYYRQKETKMTMFF